MPGVIRGQKGGRWEKAVPAGSTIPVSCAAGTVSARGLRSHRACCFRKTPVCAFSDMPPKRSSALGGGGTMAVARTAACWRFPRLRS